MCIEAFGEPAVNRRDKLASFGAAALVAAQLGEAHGGAQFVAARTLLAGSRKGLRKQASHSFTIYETRTLKMREQIEAMKEIWTRRTSQNITARSSISRR